MKKYFILAATVILSLQVMAASLGDINGTCWHDGWAFYNVTEKDGELSFEGGTLHEGGYGFKVVKGNHGKMVVMSIYEGMESITTSGRSLSGSSIERRTIDGKDVLLIKSSKGQITDVLLPMNGDFYKTLIDQQNQQLDGVYHKDGSEISFNGNGGISFGTARDKWETYSYVKIYDMPSNILSVFLDKTHISFDFDQQYIKLDEVKPKPGVDWDDDPEVETVHSTKLKKKSGLRYKGNGIWPITSVEILTSGYLSSYNVETLRLMRNDIYARYGYKFKNKELNKIFKEQSWYLPSTSDASSLKFNEIERINIALIQNMEKIKSTED